MLINILISIAICVGFVLLSLSSECRRTIRQNCRRLDGSWSSRRFRREVAAAGDYLTTMIAPLLIMFLTAFITISCLTTYVIPMDLVVDSFQAFDPNPSQWKENLTEVRRQHAEFAMAQGNSPEETHQLQRTLWESWPGMLATLVLLGFACVWLLLTTAKHAVQHWASGIRNRRTRYAKADVIRMQSPSAPDEFPAHDDRRREPSPG